MTITNDIVKLPPETFEAFVDTSIFFFTPMRPIMEKAQKHVDKLVTQYKRYKEKNNGKL